MINAGSLKQRLPVLLPVCLRNVLLGSPHTTNRSKSLTRQIGREFIGKITSLLLRMKMSRQYGDDTGISGK